MALKRVPGMKKDENGDEVSLPGGEVFAFGGRRAPPREKSDFVDPPREGDFFHPRLKARPMSGAFFFSAPWAPQGRQKEVQEGPGRDR